MSGKLQKPSRPAGPGGSLSGGLKKPAGPSGPVNINRPAIPRPAVIQRPSPVVPQRPNVPPRPSAAAVVNRGANLNRMQQRDIRREVARQAINQAVSRPTPTVRPPAPPQKIMPKQAATPRIVAPPRPVQAPVRPQAARPLGPPAAPKPQMMPRIPAPQKLATPRPAQAAVAFSGSLVINSSAAHADISAAASSLGSTLADLQKKSSFSDLYTEVTDLDKSINHAATLLESARKKGYVFQKGMEEIAYTAMDQWQAAREQALDTAERHAASFQPRLMPLSSQVQRLNMVLGSPASANAMISATQSQANAMNTELDRLHNDIRSLYSDVRSNIQGLTSRLNEVHWAFTQLDEAKFKLDKEEDLVMAVPARWDRVGNDDPEGILYLTSKRLVFERKEKIATKKVLFLAVAKELVHEVMIDQPASAIAAVKADNKGLFGHQDFILVTFRDNKLGEVPFHLNGQPSKQWVEWIQSATSGGLDDDRASGSGISYADLTGPLTMGDLMQLQTEINELQDEVMLKSAREELASLENDVRSMERKLSQLRTRGYVIEKSLESDLVVLATQWDRVKANAETTIESQARLLGEQMQGVQTSLSQLMGKSGNLDAARPQFMQLKSSIASLEAQADAATSTVMAQYDEYADETESITAHLEWVGWMLDALETASFALLATESGIAAAEAIYARPGMEPENGVLFLTDQRLLWEDRVGDFELKVNEALTKIVDLKKEAVEETGQEKLIFTFGDGANVPAASFELSLPVGDDWIKMAGRARTGGYAQDRAVEVDQAELERIRNAPSQCSNCGAVFTAPVLRGQTEIACEYCSAVTRF